MRVLTDKKYDPIKEKILQYLLTYWGSGTDPADFEIDITADPECIVITLGEDVGYFEGSKDEFYDDAEGLSELLGLKVKVKSVTPKILIFSVTI